MSIMLVVLGVMTYYVAPSAFLFGNFELFFFILNMVLLLMIIGLTFISVLVLPGMQSSLIDVILFFAVQDRKLRSLIYKNIESHEKRNTKTAVMFAICLSFLIFAGSTFMLIGTLITNTIENQVGSDLYGIDFSGASYLDE